MKESTKKVYTCDHCKKIYFRKHACINHELACTRNPENINPCLQGCAYLENHESEVSFDTYIMDYEGVNILKEFKAKCFYCTKKDIMMFPFSANRIAERFDLEEQGQYPMPVKTCEDFKVDELPF